MIDIGSVVYSFMDLVGGWSTLGDSKHKPGYQVNTAYIQRWDSFVLCSLHLSFSNFMHNGFLRHFTDAWPLSTPVRSGDTMTTLMFCNSQIMEFTVLCKREFRVEWMMMSISMHLPCQPLLLQTCLNAETNWYCLSVLYAFMDTADTEYWWILVSVLLSWRGREGASVATDSFSLQGIWWSRLLDWC